MNDASPANTGHNPVSDDVWEQIREDYLSGWSAPACARRYGVGLSTVRKRAADEKWRRGDQPPSLPKGLDRDDEGLALEERFDGDLDRIPLGELTIVAFQRMTRAVLHGNAAEALRWRRVRQALDAENAQVAERHRLQRLRREEDERIRAKESARMKVMREETTQCRRLDALEAGAGGLDGLDALDGVFAPSPPSPFILPGLPFGRAPSGPP